MSVSAACPTVVLPSSSILTLTVACAQATVSVRIEEEGKTTVGQAADTDTLVASANAYLSALNKMIIKRKKTAPLEHETQKMKGI